MNKHIQIASILIATTVPVFGAFNIKLIDNKTPAYYNGSIGTLLNGTSEAFPTDGDPILDFLAAPDLSAASEVLGSWLNSNPSLPPQHWTPIPVEVPRQWPVGSESAIVYPFDVPAGGYTNLTIDIGVDNGVFVWLDGVFLGGALRQGGAGAGEHRFTVPAVAGGRHYLQVLREDHGSTDDYIVEVTATSENFVEVQAQITTAVEVSWHSEPNALYQIQTTDDLVSGIWVNIGDPVTGDGQIIQKLISLNSSAKKFFKILKIE